MAISFRINYQLFLKFFFFFDNFLFLVQLLLARVVQHLVEGEAVVEDLLVLPLLVKLKQKQNRLRSVTMLAKGALVTVIFFVQEHLGIDIVKAP